MNDKSWPTISLDEAHARLTAPGQPFETTTVTVRGRPMTVWKHVPTTAADLFAKARTFGPREFLVLDGERVTYDAFCRAVAVLAADFHTRGLSKGDRVALVMRNLPQWPVVLMAALLNGAIVVPLNAWWTGTELAYGILDSGARFVFADDERARRLTDLPPSVEKVFDEGALESMIGKSASWASLPDVALPDVPLDPEDDATLFYTSGTSGAPKGALGTHRNILAQPFSAARNALRRGDPIPEARPRTSLVAVPFFHVVGALSNLIPTMAAGGKLILMHKFDAREAARLIEAERVTTAGGVPTVALALLEQAHDYDLSSLELVTYGGAPCPTALASRVRDQLHAMPGQGWGLTETSAACTTHSAEDYLNRPHSCGPVLPVGRLKVMRDGVEVPPGVVGEVWATGPNIVKGYWNRPAATTEIFVDGWVKTGDLASLDAEGFLTIIDRAHDMVIRGGENIYCIEVENILTQHPCVLDAALVGLPHPVLGEVPGAVVQVRGAVNEDDLRAFAAERLAAFKVPVRVVISQLPLPRNEGGKLAKTELRKVFA
jgi:long-chain acyl-CoA synthetase